MDQDRFNQAYKGAHIFGIVITGIVFVRGIMVYWGISNFTPYIIGLIIFTTAYVISLFLPDRLKQFRLLYFSLQAVLIFILGNLQPALDVTNLLFVVLGLQVVHVFSGRAAFSWLAFYAVLLTATMVLEQGWVDGMTLSLFFLAGGAFVVSYDLMYIQARANQLKSQDLLAQLQESHLKLKEYAAQAEELAAARERNRLARELHDSISHLIFSITLTARSAQILLEKDPARLPEQFDRLEEMTGRALNQLRSLISQLRPL